MMRKVPGVCVNCRLWGHHLVEKFSVGGITQPANLIGLPKTEPDKNQSLQRYASGASEKLIYLVWCVTLCDMLTPTVWNQLNLVQTPWLEKNQMCLFQASKQNERDSFLRAAPQAPLIYTWKHSVIKIITDLLCLNLTRAWRMNQNIINTDHWSRTFYW
jgi:hypothetical protein